MRGPVETVQRPLPRPGHADARLDRAPAERRPARRVLRHDGLAHPAREKAHKTLGKTFVARLPIALGQDRPLWVAAELPGPLAILVEGRVDEPVYLSFELVRRTARDQFPAQDPFGCLGHTFAAPHKIVPAKRTIHGQKPLRLQRAAHLVAKEAACAVQIAACHSRGDALQPGTGCVHPTEKVGVAQPRSHSGSLFHVPTSRWARTWSRRPGPAAPRRRSRPGGWCPAPARGRC